MKYKHYTPVMERHWRYMRKTKSIPRVKRTKKTFPTDVLRMMEKVTGSDKSPSLLMYIREIGWITRGSPTIFPSHEKLLDWVSNLKFDNGFVLDPLFDDFVICPSADSTYGTIMVNYYRSQEADIKRACRTADWLGLPFENEGDFSSPPEYPWIAVSILNTEGIGMVNHAGTPQDCANLVQGDTSHIAGYFGKEDQLEVISAVKLVLSMILYIQATQGKALIEGPPKDTTMSLKGLIDRPRSFYIKDPGLGRNGVVPHMVQGHMRVLRDKKYYEGKWEGKPIGSRVIYIDPFTKGDIEAHTLVKKPRLK